VYVRQVFEENPMTEPTHDLRRDVAAQLDILLTGIMLQVGLDDLEAARERLRGTLASAWHDGWMAGFDDSAEQRKPSQNPYHETGKE
jgi:hypothetical protein